MNSHLPARGRLAASQCWALLLAVPVCLGAEPQPPDDALYAPLEPGRTFVYRQVAGSGRVEMNVIGLVPVERGVAAEVEHRVAGKVTDYSYLSLGEDGLYQHGKVYIGPMRGVRASGPGSLGLPFPVFPGTVREYEDALKVQTSGGPPSREDLERLRFKVRIEVQAVDVPVEVPAGRFLCARVATTRTFHDGRKRESVAYYARHVGLVKLDGGLELVAFGFAPPAPPPEQVLVEWLKQGTGPISKALWCESEVLGFLRSRFARVERGAGPGLHRVFGSRAERFEVQDLAHWRRLLEDEGLDLGGGGAASLLPMRLAGAAAVLALWQAAPDAEALGRCSSTTRFEGQARKRTEVTVRGGGRVVTAAILTEGADLVGVEIARGE